MNLSSSLKKELLVKIKPLKNEYSLKLVFLIEISTAPFNISLTNIK